MNARLNAYAALPVEAIRWLANGERGISSESLMSALYGIQVGRDDLRDAPRDPDDFRRCRLMVESIPGARELLASLVDVNAGRRARVALLNTSEHWDVLCGLMDAECPTWRTTGESAPRLYDAMKQLIWRPADAYVALLPESNRNSTTGADKLDFAVGRARLDESAATAAARVAELMTMPVPNWRIAGRAAFEILREARGVMTFIIEAGDPAASRLAVVMQETSYVKAAPRSPRQEADTRRALQSCMYALWSEGRKEKTGAMSKAGYAAMRRVFDAVATKSLTPEAAPSTDSQPAPKAKPRCKA